MTPSPDVGVSVADGREVAEGDEPVFKDSVLFSASPFFSTFGDFDPPKMDPLKPTLANEEPPNAVPNEVLEATVVGADVSNAGLPPNNGLPAVIDPPPKMDAAVVVVTTVASLLPGTLGEVALPRTKPWPENGAAFEISEGDVVVGWANGNENTGGGTFGGAVTAGAGLTGVTTMLFVC